jgi:hypothetical protein
VVGFTGESRAENFRRGIELGKTAMIYKGFPCSATFERKSLVFQNQVRTVLFEKLSFFSVVVALGEKNGLFCPRRAGFHSPASEITMRSRLL